MVKWSGFFLYILHFGKTFWLFIQMLRKIDLFGKQRMFYVSYRSISQIAKSFVWFFFFTSTKKKSNCKVASYFIIKDCNNKYYYYYYYYHHIDHITDEMRKIVSLSLSLEASISYHNFFIKNLHLVSIYCAKTPLHESLVANSVDLRIVYIFLFIVYLLCPEGT